MNNNFFNLVHSNFICLFGKNKLENISDVDIGERVGWTDYIDFINIDDFSERGNVIKGVDKYQRPFISFLYKSKFINVLPSDSHEELSSDYKITTLFQRYTNEHFWMYGGNIPKGLYCGGYNFETKCGYDKLFNVMTVLLNDNQVTYKYTKDDNLNPQEVSVSLYF